MACAAIARGLACFLKEAIDNLACHSKVGGDGTWIGEERAALPVRIACNQQLQVGVIELPVEMGKGPHQLRNVLALVKSTKIKDVVLAYPIAGACCGQDTWIGDWMIFLACRFV